MIIPWTEAQRNNRPEGTGRTEWPSAYNQTRYRSLGRETFRRRGRRRGRPGHRRRCSCYQPLYPTCTSSRFPRSPWPPTRTGQKAASCWARRRRRWWCHWCRSEGLGRKRGLWSSRERKWGMGFWWWEEMGGRRLGIWREMGSSCRESWLLRICGLWIFACFMPLRVGGVSECVMVWRHKLTQPYPLVWTIGKEFGNIQL